MGGPGSGYHYHWDKKDVVEDYCALDINWLRREGYLRPGRQTPLSWTQNGHPTGNINLTAHRDRVILSYTYTYAGQSEEVRETVFIGRTPCHYGGTRPWFLCPGCGRRVGKLYAGGRLFLCRHCYNLAHYTQQMSEPFRLLHKAQKIRRRLGASPDVLDDFIPRPKGMHRRTYERLKRQALETGHRSAMLALRRSG